MNFLFLVEQAERVLYANAHGAQGVESTKWTFDGVFDERLPAWAEFHEDVVGAFLDAHDFGDGILHFQNLGEWGVVL